MKKDFFTGCAVFVVEGCDFSLLNRLRMFCVRDVCMDGDAEAKKGGIDADGHSVNQMRFTVPLVYISQVETALTGHKYSVKTNKNFFGFLNIFYSRPMLSLSAIAGIIALFILNGFVFSVKVIGIEGQYAREVEAFVYSHGARPLTYKSAGQAAKVAGEIVGSFDYVAHASSKIVGNTLIFNVYSVAIAEGENQNRDIVATADGVVTSIIIVSGRAMVSAGDVVRAGQVLIKGERQVGAVDVGRDEYGKLIQEGIFVPCRAVGEVLADIKYSEFGTDTTVDELLSKIIARTGIANFDKVEEFSAGPGLLEVVAAINRSIV